MKLLTQSHIFKDNPPLIHINENLRQKINQLLTDYNLVLTTETKQNFIQKIKRKLFSQSLINDIFWLIKRR